MNVLERIKSKLPEFTQNMEDNVSDCDEDDEEFEDEDADDLGEV